MHHEYCFSFYWSLPIIAIALALPFLVVLGACFGAIQCLQWRRLANPTMISIICVVFCISAGAWYGVDIQQRALRKEQQSKREENKLSVPDKGDSLNAPSHARGTISIIRLPGLLVEKSRSRSCRLDA